MQTIVCLEADCIKLSQQRIIAHTRNAAAMFALDRFELSYGAWRCALNTGRIRNIVVARAGSSSMMS
jgi:hypothetical protein